MIEIKIENTKIAFHATITKRWVCDHCGSMKVFVGDISDFYLSMQEHAKEHAVLELPEYDWFKLCPPAYNEHFEESSNYFYFGE